MTMGSLSKPRQCAVRSPESVSKVPPPVVPVPFSRPVEKCELAHLLTPNELQIGRSYSDFVGEGPAETEWSFETDSKARSDRLGARWPRGIPKSIHDQGIDLGMSQQLLERRQQ